MNRNIIITGSNRGIGLSLLEHFAHNGDNIWACCRKADADFLNKIKCLEEECGVWIKPILFELENDDSVKNGIKTIFADKLSIDVLINNAGITDTALLMNTTVKKIRDVFEVNYFASLTMIQQVVKKMLVKKRGIIINIASVAGIEHKPGRIAYGSSKAALIWATQCLAQEYGQFGIRINAIAPGAMDTHMVRDYSEEKQAKIISDVSLKRLGNVDEISKVALFLASEDSSFINGQIISVDGGRIC